MVQGATTAAALAVWLYLGPPSGPGMMEMAASLSDWQAPTAFLLDYPGQDVFGAQPEPGSDARRYGERARHWDI